MARLLLRFESSVLQEVEVGSRPVSIGRAPENDVRIDNLAVSNLHALVSLQDGRLVVEDCHSLNGTFVNNQRVQRATLKDHDTIAVGKHCLDVVDTNPDAVPTAEKEDRYPVPRMNETVVLDTEVRRQLLEKAGAAGERIQVARVRVPSLVVQKGRTNRKEYLLSSKLTVIGKSDLATVQLRGWFAPRVAAQISHRNGGYYIGRAERVPRVNGERVTRPTQLMEGDLIEIGRVKLRFLYRD